MLRVSFQKEFFLSRHEGTCFDEHIIKTGCAPHLPPMAGGCLKPSRRVKEHGQIIYQAWQLT
jgi:hypothetical protein